MTNEANEIQVLDLLFVPSNQREERISRHRPIIEFSPNARTRFLVIFLSSNSRNNFTDENTFGGCAVDRESGSSHVFFVSRSLKFWRVD